MSSSPPSKLSAQRWAPVVASIRWPDDPHAARRRPHAALEHVAHAELAPDLLHVHRAPLVGEARVAGDHEQPAHPRQRADDLLDDAVGEVLLRRVPAQVLERQHRDRRPVRQRRGPSPPPPPRSRPARIASASAAVSGSGRTPSSRCSRSRKRRIELQRLRRSRRARRWMAHQRPDRVLAQRVERQQPRRRRRASRARRPPGSPAAARPPPRPAAAAAAARPPASPRTPRPAPRARRAGRRGKAPAPARPPRPSPRRAAPRTPATSTLDPRRIEPHRLPVGRRPPRPSDAPQPRQRMLEAVARLRLAPVAPEHPRQPLARMRRARRERQDRQQRPLLLPRQLQLAPVAAEREPAQERQRQLRHPSSPSHPGASRRSFPDEDNARIPRPPPRFPQLSRTLR